MKQVLITCFLLLGFCSSIQAQDFLDTKINFNVNQTSKTEALNILADQTGIDIAFSANFFEDSPPITINEENTTIRQVLEKILQGSDIDYKTLGENRVLLFKATKVYYQFSGYVKDRETGEVLVGARIIANLQVSGTVTNEYGFFSLKLPADRKSVV